MKRFYVLFLLILSVSLVNCATKYKAKYWKGGYADTKIQDGVYQVNFSGNAYISARKVWIYLLYRCAEVTINNGYDHFVIYQGKDSTTEHVEGYVSSTGQISAGTLNKSDMTVMIKCGKGPKPKDNLNAYNAQELKNNLEPQIRRIPIALMH